MATEAGGKEVEATGTMTKLNQLAAGPGPAQGNGPLLLGAGMDMSGGQSGGDAEEDEAKKRALAAQGAQRPGKGSGPDPQECTAPGHPVDAVTGQVIDDAVDLRLPGAFPLVLQRWYSSARHRESSPLGRGGWTHSLAQYVDVEDEVITYRNADGRDLYFPLLDVGASWFHRSARLTLTRHREGFSLADHRERLTYHFEACRRLEHERFETSPPGPSPSSAHVSAAKSAPSTRARLATIADVLSRKISLAYDAEGRLTQVLDTAGRELRLSNDREGRLVRVEVWAAPPVDLRVADPRAQVDERGRPLASRLRRTIDYAYHETGELASVTDALGHRERFTYDGHHRMTSVSLKNGVTFRYRYDEAGRCVKTWGDGGLHEVDLTYDRTQRTTVLGATGEPRLFKWNDAGLVTEERTVDGARLVHKVVWDDDLYPVEEVLGDGIAYAYAYDARGNKVKEVDPNGNETTWEIDDDLVVKRVAPGGLVTLYERDGQGRLVGVRYPSGVSHRIDYDPRGMPARALGSDGSHDQLVFDSHFNLLERTDSRGATLRVEHDALGLPIVSRDAEGAVRRVEYDALGRPIALHGADGTTRRRDYDAMGNLVRTIDGAGHTTEMAWGGTGVLERLTSAEGHTTRFSYDSDERLTTIRNARGEEFRLEYDVLGNIVRERSFDGRVRELRHDRAGRLRRVEREDGTFRELVRDGLGNVLVERSPHGRITFERTPMGLVTKATLDEVGGPVVVELERDELGRIVAERQTCGVVESVLDAREQRVERRVRLEGELDARATRFGYDAGGALAWLEHGGQRVDYLRDGLGRVRERRLARGGLRLTNQHDAEGRLVHQWVMGQHGDSTRDARGAALKPLVERRYWYDAAGKLSAIDDARWGRASYGRDRDGRLLSSASGGLSELFEVDPAGSLVRAVATLGGRDEGAGRMRLAPGGYVLSTERATYDYDVCGRRVARRDRETGATHRYVWDCRDRLREVHRPDGSLVRFRYDAFGRRVSKEVVPRERARIDAALALTAERLEALPPVERTDFLWDGDVLCAERSSRGVRLYVNEPDALSPVLQDEGGELLVCVTDHHGTLRELVDERGRVAFAASPTTWGAGRVVTHDPERAEPVASPLGLLGHYADDETGLSYVRHRYFDPETARWLSPDPLRVFGGANLYAFDGSPVDDEDPFGLNTAIGDAGEAAAAEHLKAQGYDVLGSMQNKSGHGVDLVAISPSGELVAVEVKANSARMSDAQKKGGADFADSRAESALKGKKAWAHQKDADNNRAMAELIRQEQAEGRLKALAIRVQVDPVTLKATVIDQKPWEKC